MDFLRNTPNLKNYDLSKLFRCVTEDDFIKLTSSDIIIVGNNDISLNLIKILLNYDIESIKLIDNETPEDKIVIDKTHITILNNLEKNYNDDSIVIYCNQKYTDLIKYDKSNFKYIAIFANDIINITYVYNKLNKKLCEFDFDEFDNDIFTVLNNIEYGENSYKFKGIHKKLNFNIIRYGFNSLNQSHYFEAGIVCDNIFKLIFSKEVNQINKHYFKELHKPLTENFKFGKNNLSIYFGEDNFNKLTNKNIIIFGLNTKSLVFLDIIKDFNLKNIYLIDKNIKKTYLIQNYKINYLNFDIQIDEFNVLLSTMDIVVNTIYKYDVKKVARVCFDEKKPFFDISNSLNDYQVKSIIPFHSETFESQFEPPREITYPECKIKKYSTEKEHCVQWAIEKYNKMKQYFIDINAFVNDENYLDKLSETQKNKVINKINFYFYNNDPSNKVDIIKTILRIFYKTFNLKIKKLLELFQKIMNQKEKSSGMKIKNVQILLIWILVIHL